MTKNTQVKVFAYEISIPAIDSISNRATSKYYNYELFESFLKEIINSGNNKMMEKGKYLKLVSLNQSSDAKVVEGIFHATKYGSQNDIIDTSNDKVVSTMNPDEGVLQKVHFVIHRDTGKMLIQMDSFRVTSRSTLLDFLEKRKTAGSKAVTEFNKKNKPLVISKQDFYFLNTIPADDFYTELARLLNIKKVDINLKVTKLDVNSALARLSLPNANENEENLMDEVTDITYSFKNTQRSQGMKRVNQFIQNALDFEKIDSITAHGPKGKKVTLNRIKPKQLTVETTKDEHGILDSSLIINNMIKLVKGF